MFFLQQTSNRKVQDVVDLMKKYQLDVIEENRIMVRFHGLPGTPYYGGAWNVLVCIPTEYPLQPPSVRFREPISHPNIDKDTGWVRLDVLTNKEWSSAFDLCDVFDVFLRDLLRQPNPDDSLLDKSAAGHSGLSSSDDQ